MNRKLNLWSLVILTLSFLLAWFVWKGAVRIFDTPFGIVREVQLNILLEKIALFFLIAGILELSIHKIVNKCIRH